MRELEIKVGDVLYTVFFELIDGSKHTDETGSYVIQEPEVNPVEVYDSEGGSQNIIAELQDSVLDYFEEQGWLEFSGDFMGL